MSQTSVYTYEDPNIYFPRIIGFTVLWSIVFISYQRLLPYIINKTIRTTGINSTSFNWFTSLTQIQQQHLIGRLLFSVHHMIVAYYGYISYIHLDRLAMHMAMYHEIACDIFDVIMI